MVRVLLLGLAVALAVAGCRGHPIHNVDGASFNIVPASYGEADRQARPADLDVQTRAILLAGSNLGWSMEILEPGRIRGTLALRSHEAVVDVTYDADEFSIKYVDSTNLDYSARGTIHRKYNQWVRNLELEIRSEVQSGGRRPPPS
jgi:Neuraminidase (sialidase)